ncbi:MAG TPA: quinolinate synthase NadA [Thermoleophilia bacterium]|nr:quinolinate synthase NadA [Thermoleophilia bacterium]HQG03931.1 quinolinate synthase NadA [Thermoleophilia bacterium]HQG53866.1 quinolinate synthase NadA [Thermoleophilia bacterium]HQJ97440.1 quinolinate synthase NadA [Thermoleophilia bacterium]
MSTDFSAQQAELRRLAAARNAVVLAHNYQRAEVQEAADFVGDSLELARIAAATEADVILFCGVHFMAETAKILSPQKTVLMPDRRAGCPMADMITADDVRALRAEHPGAVVVAYVNTTAAVKAEVDVCCTSANAAQIVARYPEEQEIVFVPDQHLGDWVAHQTGRRMTLWPGYCPVHVIIRPEDIVARRAEHPGAKVMAHPECPRAVADLADVVTSTSGMLRYPQSDDTATYVVATEVGLLTGLRKRHPSRTFVAASEYAVCANMKLGTLEGAIAALHDGLNEVTVPDDVRERALRAVTRMVE